MDDFERQHEAAQRDEGVRGERSDAGPSPRQATQGDASLETESRGDREGLFPSDVGGRTDIGEGPEDRHVLDEEMNR